MKPVVAVVCDTNQQGPHLFHQAGDKYLQALHRCAGVTPVLVPSLTTPMSVEDLLSFADGILFTGGYSNIERHHYGEPAAPPEEVQDPARDSNTLHIVGAVIEAGLPMLGICRGLQEINVALGGSLHPRLHEVADRFDHREDKDSPIEEQYDLAHSISVQKDGLLAAITGADSFEVNSLHGQGINMLAPTLTVEAYASDMTIEAVSVKNAKSFALAVQWHPEWMAWKNPHSTAIFRAFGEAVREYQQAKR